MSGDPRAPDHLGWDLVRAARLWEARFTAAMIAAGHNWFGEARANLIQHIGRSGIPQGALAERAGISKQAVQQHLDLLERDGVVTRAPDPQDARRVRVIFTNAGVAMLADADRIKGEIETIMAEEIGLRNREDLRRLLKLWIGESKSVK